MKNKCRTAIALILSLWFVGCQGQQSDNAAGEANPTSAASAASQTSAEGLASQATQAAMPASQASPQEVVAAFLTALRTGDDTLAAGLLTDKAREETAKRNLVVQPPGAPSATYQVQGVEYAAPRKDAAYVSSQWTETDYDGAAHTYEITWVLRPQSDGWRVAGMATTVGQTQRKLLFNFEDPEQMLRNWQQADAELAAEAEPAAQQARNPAAGGSATTTR